MCNLTCESIEISQQSKDLFEKYLPTRINHIDAESTRIAALALAGCNLEEIQAILECSKKRTCKNDVSVEEKQRRQRLLKAANDRSEENLNP